VTLALIAFASLLAALWAFTAIQARRIERRYPTVGRKVDVAGRAVHVVERAARSAARRCSFMAPRETSPI